jgi:hypothetical protein
MRPVSELFAGQHNTDEPNMPLSTVVTVAVDSGGGMPITWNNPVPG